MRHRRQQVGHALARFDLAGVNEVAAGHGRRRRLWQFGAARQHEVRRHRCHELGHRPRHLRCQADEPVDGSDET